MKREDGYYWVKMEGIWEVAEYTQPNQHHEGYWSVIGYIGATDDESMEAIDERRIVRDEHESHTEDPKEYIIDLGNDFISIT